MLQIRVALSTYEIVVDSGKLYHTTAQAQCGGSTVSYGKGCVSQQADSGFGQSVAGFAQGSGLQSSRASGCGGNQFPVPKGGNDVCLDHADVNASFNIGKPIPPHILDQFDIDRDKSKGSSDTPKEADLINDKDLETMKPLEPTRF